MRHILLGFSLIFITYSAFSQNEKNSSRKETLGGVFTPYIIDSSNIGRIFYENGKVKYEVEFKIKKSLFGKRIMKENGLWYYYDETGFLKELGSYYKGKKMAYGYFIIIMGIL
jgi:hypothetical protein